MDNYRNHWWVDRPWRLIQTNLREIDMLDMDAKRFVSDLQEFKANVVMLSTSGIVANYDTRLPYHFKNLYLKGDSLYEVVDECHKAGIKVIARMDFSKIRRPIYEKNPEWAFVSRTGQIIDYNGDVHLCFNSEYQQQLSLEIMKETIELLDADGVFFNMDGYNNNFDYSGNYYGICHCDNCKKRFETMYGSALPETETPEDPAYQKYLEFQTATVKMHREKVYKFLTSLKTELCIANHYEFNSGFIRNEAGTSLMFPYWQYAASENTKISASTFPDMVPSTAAVDFIDIAYRHAAVSPYLQKQRLLQSLANGGGLDYYRMGRLDNSKDKTGYEAIKEVYHYQAAHEAEYMDLKSAAEIALFQEDTKKFSYKKEKDFCGWYRFLTENHFLFDVITTGETAVKDFSKYKTLIIPDGLHIDENLADRIDTFAQAGGTVIVESLSGLRDTPDKSQKTPVFQCLGIREITEIAMDMKPSYLQLDSKADLPRLSQTELVYLRGGYVYADYSESAKGFLKLIPPHMFGPPERCYYTNITDYPGFTVNSYEKGRGIYIPWNPGAMFYMDGHTNTIDFIGDLLEHVLAVKPLVGNLSRTVEVNLMRNSESDLLLHLINGSGHFGNSFYKPVAMQEITITIDCTSVPKLVKSLVRNTEYSFDIKKGRLSVYIDKLEDFDAIKIMFG